MEMNEEINPKIGEMYEVDGWRVVTITQDGEQVKVRCQTTRGGAEATINVHDWIMLPAPDRREYVREVAWRAFPFRLPFRRGS